MMYFKTPKNFTSTTPGQILISAASYEAIKESFQCLLVGEVFLKNKTKPVVLYEVVE